MIEGSEQLDFSEPPATSLGRRRPWSDLASCDNETGVPTGRSTAAWRLNLLGVHASTYKQPRDH
jgi:hypothetical protein